MRWSASAPVTWPADHRWQRLREELVDRAAAGMRVEPDGTVRMDGAGPGDPEVRLAAGTHLQPGADYRIAPELTTGLVRGWVGAVAGVGRTAGIEWAPYAEPGRAHVELQGLDRLVEARFASDLAVLRGRGRFAPGESEALDLEVEVPWLRVELRAGVRAGELTVSLRVRGLGAWWPTLAPLMLAGRASFQRELETAVLELAETLTTFATTGDLAIPAVESLEDVQRRHERELRGGLSELARRQRTVRDRLSILPWWRRTPARWRAEVAGLPTPTWPAGALLWPPTWVEVEQELTARVLRGLPWRRDDLLEKRVAAFADELVATRLAADADSRRAADAARAEPWLTDEALDLSWLATPTRLLAEARGVSSP
ncbi:hypothetical protein [Nocardioides flavescens]|uniref:Uncharacterized protein n=1 Tax=Nocardioides flavescens TaxID=2691959 RepID=A0A6L7EXA9_9ACTN|nr:hypothetical protein [Nocardioides flavescens]MXG88002.1 hypothetical protein [Nocardioides flavescens]